MREKKIVISTGSRLHFGLLANALESGRQFGGAGLMIATPGFRVSFQPAEQDAVTGPEYWRLRALQHLAAYRQAAPSDHPPPCCRMELLETIPPHTGLGSGTQLGMAVAQGLAVLAGDGRATAVELAGRVGRGVRSALGIHGFQQGGFLVEAGKTAQTPIGPLVARADFPSAWRMLLVRPRAACGLSGAAELAAFAELAPMPAATTDRLCRIVLLELLPAILEGDGPRCGEALYAFGYAVGEYFAPAQHGIYADPRMARLVEHLRQSGIRGVGQSSWGPTLFVLCPDETQAASLIADLAKTEWSDCEYTIAAPLNTGAALECG